MSQDAWTEHEEHIGREVNVVGDVYIDDMEQNDDFEQQQDVEEYYDDGIEFPDAVYPQMIENRVDVNRLMSDLFRPGTNHVTDGMRGGGKTHQAVAYCEAMVKGVYPGMPKVIMLTNIIFVKRVSTTGDLESQFVMEDPPGVCHVTSMESMFRTITRFLKVYGRSNVMFMLVLDEAQNFLLADEYQQDTSINFIKLYGTTRKFNMCIWLLTPSINNLPPRARNFLDADPSGYVTCQWRKNKEAALHYIRENCLVGMDPREITTVRMGQNSEPIQFRVGSTSWTRPLEELAVGEYGYDHLANADFRVSNSRDPNRAFDFTSFLEKCSDVPSYKIASVMQNFFDRMDGKVHDPDDDNIRSDPKADKTSEIARMRDLGLTFDDIEYITKIPASTCRLWLKKYSSTAGDGTGSPQRTGSGGAVRTGRGRTPKGVLRTGNNAPRMEGETGSETPENPHFSDSSENAEVAQNQDSQTFAQQQSNPPSNAPYISIPRNPENEGVPREELRNDPRKVDGQMPPKTDSNSGDGEGLE